MALMWLQVCSICAATSSEGVVKPLTRPQWCPLGNAKCVLPCEWPRVVCDDGLRPESGRRIAVMVTAWGRSGTTFVGELLQRNARFLYLYEPLRSQFREHYGRAPAKHALASAAFFKRLFACTMNRRDRMFLFKDKAGLSRGGLCGVAPASVPELCRCKHLAVKTIRLNGALGDVIDVLQNGPLPQAGARLAVGLPEPGVQAAPSVVHILQLIRDPRGLICSWEPLPGFVHVTGDSSAKHVHNVSRTICRKSLKDYHSGLQAEHAGPARPGALTVRYRLFKYEEFGLQPLRSAETLYNWLGLPLPAAMRTWMIESTHNKGKDEAVAPGIGDAAKEHTTVRNASAVIDRWRVELNKLHIVAVTHACADFLTTFGYQTDLRGIVPEHTLRKQYPYERGHS